MTNFSRSEPPVPDEALPYTMTLKIILSRTYELRRMPGSFPAPMEDEDIVITPREEEVLNLNISPSKLRRGTRVA